MKENLVKPTKNHIILCYTRPFAILFPEVRCKNAIEDVLPEEEEKEDHFFHFRLYTVHTGAFGCSRPSLMLFRFGPARYQQPSSSSSYVRTSKGFSGEGGLLAVCNQATREIFVRFSLSSHFSRI